MSAWQSRLTPEHISHVCKTAVQSGQLGPHDRSVIFHNLALMRARVRCLDDAFPSALHAIAIKGNPLVAILRAAVEEGAGLEAASMEEVHIALKADCPAERIVFDSPAKTHVELAAALELGVIVNADNFDELARIDSLVQHSPGKSAIGIRINPMVGAGAIAITSVADADSKFGVRLDTERAAVLDAFKRYPWLNGVHVHVGSQGCEVSQLVQAAVKIQTLIDDIEHTMGSGRIRFVDIGGGLPAVYDSGAPAIDLQAYASALRQHAPGLMAQGRRIVTEFGRALQAGCGFAVSRVEYVKSLGNKQLAVIHLGADMFMRPVYLPSQWRHEHIALDADGELKTGGEAPWTIAGPLCFAGDIVCADTALPTLVPGDFIAIRDAGAYTLSMWSRHCSRGMPLVLGYESDPPALHVLRARETPEDIARFWS